MSDISATPLNHERLEECSIDELKLIKQSWLNEKKSHVEKLLEIENTLMYIHMQLCEKGAYDDGEQNQS